MNVKRLPRGYLALHCGGQAMKAVDQRAVAQEDRGQRVSIVDAADQRFNRVAVSTNALAGPLVERDMVDSFAEAFYRHGPDVDAGHIVTEWNPVEVAQPVL